MVSTPQTLRTVIDSRALAFVLWPLSVLMLLGRPQTVKAQFTFTTNNGTITITKYTGTNGVVVIPSASNGLPVTTIGSTAFAESLDGVPRLTSVTIPNSVTSIGNSAFAGCKLLSAVTLP